MVLAGVFQRAQPRPHGQGGTSCVRGVFLCECQEQLCDAELWRLILVMISEALALFIFLALRSLCACPCTAVQPLMWGPRASRDLQSSSHGALLQSRLQHVKHCLAGFQRRMG